MRFLFDKRFLLLFAVFVSNVSGQDKPFSLTFDSKLTKINKALEPHEELSATASLDCLVGFADKKNQTVIIVDAEANKLVAKYKFPKDTDLGRSIVLVNPKMLMVEDQKKGLCLWDLSDGSTLVLLEPFRIHRALIKQRKSEQSPIFVGDESICYRFDVKERKLLKFTEYKSESIVGLGYSENSKIVIAGYVTKKKEYSLRTFDLDGKLLGHQKLKCSLQFKSITVNEQTGRFAVATSAGILTYTTKDISEKPITLFDDVPPNLELFEFQRGFIGFETEGMLFFPESDKSSMYKLKIKNQWMQNLINLNNKKIAIIAQDSNVYTPKK